MECIRKKIKKNYEDLFDNRCRRLVLRLQRHLAVGAAKTKGISSDESVRSFGRLEGKNTAVTTTTTVRTGRDEDIFRSHAVLHERYTGAKVTGTFGNEEKFRRNKTERERDKIKLKNKKNFLATFSSLTF